MWERGEIEMVMVISCFYCLNLALDVIMTWFLLWLWLLLLPLLAIFLFTNSIYMSSSQPTLHLLFIPLRFYHHVILSYIYSPTYSLPIFLSVPFRSPFFPPLLITINPSFCNISQNTMLTLIPCNIFQLSNIIK